MKRLFPYVILAFATLALSGCSDNGTPQPQKGTYAPVTVSFDFSMKGFNGSSTMGTFGVAATESEAQAAIGTLLSGTIVWSETNGGKNSKTFVLANRPKGEKLWAFVTTDTPLAAGQSLALSWTVANTASLTTSSPAIVVVPFTTN